MNELLPWVSPLAAVAAIIIALLGNRSKAHAERISALETRIDALEDRMTKAEQNMPERNATHRMEVSITKMEGDLQVLAERLKPVSDMATRFQDYMLSNSK